MAQLIQKLISAMMVEVFKTNVTDPSDAGPLLDVLRRKMELVKASFDHDDCDCVLRIEGADLCAETVIQMLAEHGFHCAVLD